MYIISKCLLGENCKYNGGNNYDEAVVKFSEEHSYIAVCPEVLGGLPTPRIPAEKIGEKIINRQGDDVTENFRLGSEKAFEEVLLEGKRRGEPIEGAILKAKSPSCGADLIYDGNFNGKLVEGDGVFASLLKKNNIRIKNEKESTNGKF